MLITETLYGGIKAFVVSENLIMKKVPGASSLMSAYKGFLNKTTFGLSDNIAGQIDEQIKKFVKSYIEKHLKNSEQFLIQAFDNKMIRKSGDEIWVKAGKYDSHSIAEFIHKGHIDSISQNVREFWSEYRQSSIFSDLSKTSITYFFERYGSKKISRLLKVMGITSDIIITELEKTALPIIENKIVQTYLEKRIRVRLERFYNQEKPTEQPDAAAPASGNQRVEKTEDRAPLDLIYAVIEKSDKGIDSKTLKIKTGLESKIIQSMVKKLKKQGKITTAGRGVYIAA